MESLSLPIILMSLLTSRAKNNPNNNIEKKPNDKEPTSAYPLALRVAGALYISSDLKNL